MMNFRTAFTEFLFLKIVAFCVNIITWLIIVLKIRPNAELIPLHYNVFSGTDVVGKGYYLYLIPAVGLAIILINEMFYHYSAQRDSFAGKMLVGISILTQIILCIAVLRLRSKILI